jgi:hypothetical protein
MQASCGVNEHPFYWRAACGTHRVKSHGRGIASWLSFNDIHPSPFRPQLGLFDGGGAEGVCRHQ